MLKSNLRKSQFDLIHKIGKMNLEIFNLMGAIACLFWFLDFTISMGIIFQMMGVSFLFSLILAALSIFIQNLYKKALIVEVEELRKQKAARWIG